MAKPWCSLGLSSITAAVAIGRKAAAPRARGSWASSTSQSPWLLRAEKASSTVPMAKQARLSPSPCAIGRLARA